MSWWAIVALAVGVSGQRLIGMFWAGPLLARRPLLARLADLLPAAVIAGVIAQLAFTTNAQLALDARAAGLLAACVMVWRRASLFVVVFVAAGATALVRLLA
ncbi:MAG: AzlD domain-containing protein [Acidimicrobiia bacterium]|nr:AzlD domain-containing protein [Acidimicrobiia bacterium]